VTVTRIVIPAQAGIQYLAVGFTRSSGCFDLRIVLLQLNTAVIAIEVLLVI